MVESERLEERPAGEPITKGSRYWPRASFPFRRTRQRSFPPLLIQIALGLLLLSGATGIALVFFPASDLVNVSMVYLVASVAAGLVFEPRVTLLVGSLGALLFDLLFVPPRFSPAVYDPKYIVSFGIMIVVSFLISELALQSRRRMAEVLSREKHSRMLYEFSRELFTARVPSEILETLARRVSVEFDAQASIEMTHGESIPPRARVGAESVRLPIQAGRRVFAWLSIQRNARGKPQSIGQDYLLEGVINLTAIAYERALFADAVEKERIRIEAEQLRNVLLSSISHDLRTPLTVILGAATSLLEDYDTIERKNALSLLQSMAKEATEMSDLVVNILEMTRLESGGVKLTNAWYDLEEIVRETCEQRRIQLEGHPLRFDFAKDLHLVRCDASRIRQVIGNLLENATRYTPPGSPLLISLRDEGERIVFSLRDYGPGIEAEHATDLFEKFHQATPESGRSGVGLGLAICKAIVLMHGGAIEARNEPPAGAVFEFWLPLTPAPAALEIGMKGIL